MNGKTLFSIVGALRKFNNIDNKGYPILSLKKLPLQTDLIIELIKKYKSYYKNLLNKI